MRAFLLTCSLLFLAMCAGDQLLSQRSPILDFDPIEKQLAMNTARLDSVERQIASIQNWQSSHDQSGLIYQSQLEGRVRVLERETDQHDKLLWFIITLILALCIGTAVRLALSGTQGQDRSKEQG